MKSATEMRENSIGEKNRQNSMILDILEKYINTCIECNSTMGRLATRIYFSDLYESIKDVDLIIYFNQSNGYTNTNTTIINVLLNKYKDAGYEIKLIKNEFNYTESFIISWYGFKPTIEDCIVNIINY